MIHEHCRSRSTAERQFNHRSREPRFHRGVRRWRSLSNPQQLPRANRIDIHQVRKKRDERVDTITLHRTKCSTIAVRFYVPGHGRGLGRSAVQRRLVFGLWANSNHAFTPFPLSSSVSASSLSSLGAPSAVDCKASLPFRRTLAGNAHTHMHMHISHRLGTTDG